MRLPLSALDIGIFAAYFVGIAVLGLDRLPQGRPHQARLFPGGRQASLVDGRRQHRRREHLEPPFRQHHGHGVLRGLCRDEHRLARRLHRLVRPAVDLLCRIYLRNGFYTMPEFLDRRFGGPARVVYGVLIFLTYVFVEIAAVLFLGALAINTLIPSVEIWQAVIVLGRVDGRLHDDGRPASRRLDRDAATGRPDVRRGHPRGQGRCGIRRSVGFTASSERCERLAPACWLPPMRRFPGPCFSAESCASACSTTRPTSSSCNDAWPPRTSGTPGWASSPSTTCRSCCR